MRMKSKVNTRWNTGGRAGRLFWAAVLAVVPLLAAAESSWAKNIVVTNQTGVEIERIFLSESGRHEWKAYYAGGPEARIKLGRRVTLNLERTMEHWDLLATGPGGLEMIFQNLDFLYNDRVVLYPFGETLQQ